MKKYNIIDSNALGYAAQSTHKLHSGGMETQAAFGFIRTLADLRKKYPQHKPMCLWDGKATWRFQLNEEYKSNRTDTPEKTVERNAYATMRPYIAKMLESLGVWQMTAYTHEADDMAGYFVETLSKQPSTEILLTTGDGDWKQLVRRNVAWEDPRDDAKYIDHTNFYNRTGCKTPFAFLETKILQGDTSDCISGVGGIGAKGAPEFIAEFGSVRRFWQAVDNGSFVPRLKKHIGLASPEGRAIYKRNFQMMQLLRVTPPAKTDTAINPGKFDKDAFAAIAEELAFTSILRNLDQFTNRFKGATS